MGFDVIAQPVDVIGEFEVPVFFLDFLNLAPFRPELAFFVAIAVGEKLFLPDRVESLVRFLVELAVVVEFLKNRLNAGDVITTGACATPTITPFGKIEAIFEGLGTVTAEIKKA